MAHFAERPDIGSSQGANEDVRQCREHEIPIIVGYAKIGPEQADGTEKTWKLAAQIPLAVPLQRRMVPYMVFAEKVSGTLTIAVTLASDGAQRKGMPLI